MADERRNVLIDAYRDAFEGWNDVVDGIDDVAWSTPTGCPGWAVRDQFAHVISIERRMLGDRHEQIELPHDLAHVKNDFGRFVEHGVWSRRDVVPADLLEEARETFERRLAQLGELPASYLDDQVEGPAPGMLMRGAQMLRTRLYDLATHEYDVRRPLGRLDGPGGGHVAVSLELVVRAWSKVLPQVVPGSPVLALEVDGAELGRLDLGEGTLHRDEDGPDADARMVVTVAQLLAVAGGRSDAPQLGDIDASGDLEVVRAVLGADGITP